MKLQEIIRNNYKFAGIAAASFLIDEGMKNYVEEYDVLDTPKEILDGKAVLRRYHNKGAFLNFGEQKRKLVTLLSVLLTAAVLVPHRTRSTASGVVTLVSAPTPRTPTSRAGTRRQLRTARLCGST